MFSLTLRDQLLITAILVATVVGAATKHWRDARREGSGSAGQPQAKTAVTHFQQVPGTQHATVSVVRNAP